MSNQINEFKQEIIRHIGLPNDVVTLIMSFYFQVHPIVLNTHLNLYISEYQRFIKDGNGYFPFYSYYKKKDYIMTSCETKLVTYRD